jgi:hypothetical protein
MLLHLVLLLRDIIREQVLLAEKKDMTSSYTHTRPAGLLLVLQPEEPQLGPKLHVGRQIKCDKGR